MPSKGLRIDNDLLLRVGLELMEKNGRNLSRLPSSGRSMLYSFSNKGKQESVRVRTCNDHILIVIADSTSPDARLNIEGTDWLLITMPEIERTPGNVIAYLVPSSVAADAARQTHKEWLATNPNTKGGNTTWNLWFDEDASWKACDFARKWSQYRLAGTANIESLVDVSAVQDAAGNVRAEVEAARKRISSVAGVPLDAVKVTIQFGI